MPGRYTVQQAGMPYGAVTGKAIDWYYGLVEYNFTVTNNRISYMAKIASGCMNEHTDSIVNSNFILLYAVAGYSYNNQL